jgi:SAM-dependent methyltransferase
MPNPWLQIRLEDYEGHMASPEVLQASALGELFAQALAIVQPASVAILGVAGGNGLERIGPGTERVVGIDLNPRFLDVIRERYAHLPGLELHCVDLSQQVIEIAPVHMVHAALIFEHAGIGRCLENALSLLLPKGALSVVVQLPSQTTGTVGTSGFVSMERLKDHFFFVDPMRLRSLLELRQYRLAHEVSCLVAAGKAFWMGVFLQA